MDKSCRILQMISEDGQLIIFYNKISGEAYIVPARGLELRPPTLYNRDIDEASGLGDHKKSAQSGFFEFLILKGSLWDFQFVISN